MKMKMKFKLNVKTITLSVIVFIVTIISLYYLILDMDSIAFAEQIDRIDLFIQNDLLNEAEEELGKREKKLARNRKEAMVEDTILLILMVCVAVLWVPMYGTGPVELTGPRGEPIDPRVLEELLNPTPPVQYIEPRDF